MTILKRAAQALAVTTAYTGGFYGSMFAGPAIAKATSSTEPTEQQNMLALLLSTGVYVVSTIALGACILICSNKTPKVELDPDLEKCLPKPCRR